MQCRSFHLFSSGIIYLLCTWHRNNKIHCIFRSVLSTGVGDREFMQLYPVAHIDALAVCNDGSSGVYYHRPGTADNSTR